ncbi:hypothetical protein R6Q59_031730 [Mikania micrantha]
MVCKEFFGCHLMRGLGLIFGLYGVWLAMACAFCWLSSVYKAWGQTGLGMGIGLLVLLRFWPCVFTISHGVCGPKLDRWWAELLWLVCHSFWGCRSRGFLQSELILVGPEGFCLGCCWPWLGLMYLTCLVMGSGGLRLLVQKGCWLTRGPFLWGVGVNFDWAVMEGVWCLLMVSST